MNSYEEESREQEYQEEDEDEEEEEDEAESPEGEEASGPAVGAASENVLTVPAISSLDSLYGLREIGREALCWQLSSAKPGNGVEQIRDQSTETYWQSDGVSQPHWIQVHFARRVAISHVCLYLDYNLDESYTPKHINVQVGMTTQDLTPALYPTNTLVDLNEPVGWCIIPLTAPPDPLDEENSDEDEDADNGESNNDRLSKRKQRLLRTHMIQISIIAMHQNGRDTHIRQVQLYGPRMAGVLPGGVTASIPNAVQAEEGMLATTREEVNSDWNKQQLTLQEFSTTTMSQFSVIR